MGGDNRPPPQSVLAHEKDDEAVPAAADAARCGEGGPDMSRAAAAAHKPALAAGRIGDEADRAAAAAEQVDVWRGPYHIGPAARAAHASGARMAMAAAAAADPPGAAVGRVGASRSASAGEAVAVALTAAVGTHRDVNEGSANRVELSGDGSARSRPNVGRSAERAAAVAVGVVRHSRRGKPITAAAGSSASSGGRTRGAFASGPAGRSLVGSRARGAAGSPRPGAAAAARRPARRRRRCRGAARVVDAAAAARAARRAGRNAARRRVAGSPARRRQRPSPVAQGGRAAGDARARSDRSPAGSDRGRDGFAGRDAQVGILSPTTSAAARSRDHARPARAYRAATPARAADADPRLGAAGRDRHGGRGEELVKDGLAAGAAN